jgi:2'-5' RNA ligase
MRFKTTPGMIRVSVVIDLPPPVRAALDKIQQQLAKRVLPLHILDHEDLHLTLAFLGEIVPNQIPLVAQCVNQACIATAPFELEVAWLGMGPKPHAPEAFWASIAAGSAGLPILLTLREHLVKHLEATGFSVDPWFVPHITLARLHPQIPRSARDQVVQAITELQDFPPVLLSVSQITVQSTKARPGGASYQPLARIILQPTVPQLPSA